MSGIEGRKLLFLPIREAAETYFDQSDKRYDADELLIFECSIIYGKEVNIVKGSKNRAGKYHLNDIKNVLKNY